MNEDPIEGVLDAESSSVDGSKASLCISRLLYFTAPMCLHGLEERGIAGVIYLKILSISNVTGGAFAPNSIFFNPTVYLSSPVIR